ncbi:hypothetical protein CRYUN_Cryun37aG0036100 [Craigia yunnanensis]
MRFKKGCKVEVLTKVEVPTGAWRCAEIISGNGHTYSVKYGWFPITGETAAVGRVNRKAIRPCPPPINGTDDWVSGDVVEVFDELCWKPAAIVRVFGGNIFSVRILGSNSELKAHQSRLRVRQSWEDGNWFLVGKGSLNSTGPLKRKRSSLGFSEVGGQKKRVIEKGSIGGKRIIFRFPSPASEKVDAFVSPQNIPGETCMPSSFHRIEDTMSCASSVGSCSGLGNNDLNLSPSSVTNRCENLEDYCSDADSYSERRCGEEGCSVSSGVELGTDFHRSELHVYQQALGALHASGHLTWEEEEKLTRGQHPWFIPRGTLKPCCCHGLKEVLQFISFNTRVTAHGQSLPHVPWLPPFVASFDEQDNLQDSRRDSTTLSDPPLPHPRHQIREGLHYNPYFPSGVIAMPKMLIDGAVEYEACTLATSPSNLPTMGKDVVTFLTWAAEPEMEERKLMGFKWIFVLSLALLQAAHHRRLKWSVLKSRKLVLDVVN